MFKEFLLLIALGVSLPPCLSDRIDDLVGGQWVLRPHLFEEYHVHIRSEESRMFHFRQEEPDESGHFTFERVSAGSEYFYIRSYKYRSLYMYMSERKDRRIHISTSEPGFEGQFKPIYTPEGRYRFESRKYVGMHLCTSDVYGNLGGCMLDGDSPNTLFRLEQKAI